MHHQSLNASTPGQPREPGVPLEEENDPTFVIDPKVPGAQFEPEVHRLGPELASWPSSLTENFD